MANDKFFPYPSKTLYSNNNKLKSNLTQTEESFKNILLKKKATLGYINSNNGIK